MNQLPMNADARVEASGSDGSAEALVWWRHAPRLPGETSGVIGGFKATTAAAATDVLERAGEALRAQRCTFAVGPMDGNTWRRYRFVTEAGTEPPFLLEPVNPPEWPVWWRAAGFEPLAEYHSTATRDLTSRDERVARVTARMTAAGMTIREIDPARFEEELGRIHDVSVISFQENYLYTPLPREEFIAQYGAMRSQMRPELLLLAVHAGRPVGYVFAIPDLAEAKRGEPVKTIIVKTLAVLPGRTYAGLGAVLLDAVHAAAQRLGFRRAIHALMHETNASRNLSAHYAQTIRRYTLFARRL
ncbi:MAG: GNAT family N-acetyltransferase [Opitutaceae bacterium]